MLIGESESVLKKEAGGERGGERNVCCKGSNWGERNSFVKFAGSIGRWLVHSLARSVAGSFVRWLVRSLTRSFAGSRAGSVSRPLARWLAGSFARWPSLAYVSFPVDCRGLALFSSLL